MENETIGVEEKETIAPESQEVEKGVENASTTQDSGIDYKAELEAQLKKVSLERDNYKKGLLIAKGKVEDDGYEMEETVNKANWESKIDSLVEAKIEERLSSIKTSLTKNVVANTLSELSTNEDERALIKYHYDNSIVKTGMDPEAIRNDMENAKMIANKKSYFRTTKEMATALKNRSGISTAGAGASAEKNESEPQYFSQEMIQKMKERGFTNAAADPKKVAEIMKKMKGKL